MNGLREKPPVWFEGKQIHAGYVPPPGTPKPLEVPIPPDWHDPYYQRNAKSKELYGNKDGPRLRDEA